MKTKTWQKTVIDWGGESTLVKRTTIPHYDRGMFYGIWRFKAVSAIARVDGKSSRVAVITFSISGGFYHHCNNVSFEVENRLATLRGKWRFINSSKRHSEVAHSCVNFKICLLKVSQSFCTEVVDFVVDLFNQLGVPDKSENYFLVDTQTLYEKNNGYISFTEYFKMKRGIPVEPLHYEFMPNMNPLR